MKLNSDDTHIFVAYILITKIYIMWIDQCCNGIYLRNTKAENYNRIHKYLNENFSNNFSYDPFLRRFFVSDNLYGRHKTIQKIREEQLDDDMPS